MNELEERWRELGEFIREQRRLGELSLRKLSELAGVSNPYLSQIERGLRKPSADILRQIAGALHISAETLYVRAGILDEDAATVDLVAEIRRDPHLDEDQKRALIHIYQSFRNERATRMVDQRDDGDEDPVDGATAVDGDAPVDGVDDPDDGAEGGGPAAADPGPAAGPEPAAAGGSDHV